MGSNMTEATDQMDHNLEDGTKETPDDETIATVANTPYKAPEKGSDYEEELVNIEKKQAVAWGIDCTKYQPVSKDSDDGYASDGTNESDTLRVVKIPCKVLMQLFPTKFPPPYSIPEGFNGDKWLQNLEERVQCGVNLCRQPVT